MGELEELAECEVERELEGPEGAALVGWRRGTEVGRALEDPPSASSSGFRFARWEGRRGIAGWARTMVDMLNTEIERDEAFAVV